MWLHSTLCTYVRISRIPRTVHDTITLTELRQQLFVLADRVIETGEPLVIERRGVRLRLARDDASENQVGRLAKLRPRAQSVVIGAPLDPHESPARWDGAALPKVAEPAAPRWSSKRKAGKPHA